MTYYYENLDLSDITYFCEIDMLWKIELWRDIPNHIGLYKVSDLGRAKSLDRMVRHKRWGGHAFYEGKILKQNYSKNEYLCFRTSNEDVKTTHFTHQLVAAVFNGHVVSGREEVVDHKNNIKLDNRAVNLQSITHRKNTSKDIKNKTSRYTGVSWDREEKKWASNIQRNGVKLRLIRTTNEDLANSMYQIALANIHLFNGCRKSFRELVKTILKEK